MVELLVLGALVGGVALVAAIGMAVLVLLKFVFWLVFLPLRILFKLLLLPLLLIKWVFAGVLLVPILVVIAAVGAIALVAAVIVPLLPIVFVALAIWALVKLFTAPATV